MVGLLAVEGESIIAKAYTTNHSWIHKHRIKDPNPSLVRIRQSNEKVCYMNGLNTIQ